jgi:hypothetical protein
VNLESLWLRTIARKDTRGGTLVLPSRKGISGRSNGLGPFEMVKSVPMSHWLTRALRSLEDQHSGITSRPDAISSFPLITLTGDLRAIDRATGEFVQSGLVSGAKRRFATRFRHKGR